MASTFDTVPTIDLAAARAGAGPRQELADDLRKVCHDVGFFVVTDHGVDRDLVERVFELMGRFFDLPDEKKALIDKRQSAHFRGWEAVGVERTNNRPDIREQTDIWSEWPARSPNVDPAYLRLLGPNQWLPDEVLPGARTLITAWFGALSKLADDLLRLLALGLGLEEDHLVAYFGSEPMSLTKLISYPATPAGQAGVNAHHDTGFVTVLAAGSTPGLQVQNPEGDWIEVTPATDRFVINLGEMLQAMTGNYFVATPHRVITTEPRLSAGYFHGPSLNASLTPLPLASSFRDAVAASPRHADAGFMAGRQETIDGVGDMQSNHQASTYGEQLWNYFARSYPENMARHYGPVS